MVWVIRVFGLVLVIWVNWTVRVHFCMSDLGGLSELSDLGGLTCVGGMGGLCGLCCLGGLGGRLVCRSGFEVLFCHGC